MKHKELKTLSPEDREKKKQDAEMELMKLQSQVATGTSPKNPNQIRHLKKILARIKSIDNIEKQK